MSIWSSNTCFLPLDYSSRLDKVSYLKKKKKATLHFQDLFAVTINNYSINQCESN